MSGMENASKTVRLTKRGVELNGNPEVLLCGSLFYFRLPRAVWKDRAEKLKRAGYNCVDVYFPWNYHECEDGSFSFEGEKDIDCFLQELQAAGLYVIARPGPYICSEWNGGALPARVLESGMPIRCAHPWFIEQAAKWYDAVLPHIARYSFARGGNVILVQLENELDFFDCPDPQAYIGQLADIAKRYITDLPLFCCAGQYDVFRAGGLTEGVEATLNCYPDSADNTFDAELQRYALLFAKREKPLLVSETNRDHFLLRRELSCGAKLLGAYNQVAGVNFGYSQAVNNWGKPDAMLATVYDFASMIGPTGDYRPEAKEAVLFGGFLQTTGRALAGALPAEHSIAPDGCSFATTQGGLRVLMLEGGGAAVCVPNFSEKKGKITFAYENKQVQAEVAPMHAPFCLFDFSLKSHGINAVLTRANCEPIYADAQTLVFVCQGKPAVGLDFGNGETTVTANTQINGVRILFETKEQAIERLTNGRPPVSGDKKTTSVSAFYAAEPPAPRTVSAANGTHFGALPLTEGEAAYTVSVPAGQKLFIEHPCDMLQIIADGISGETVFADGRNVIAPACQTGRYVIRAEKWGHSNFDDPQSPALRASCKKGVTAFGAVVKEQPVGRCDFRLLDTFGAPHISLDGQLPVRIGIDKWNSTRKPAVCSYTLPVTRIAQRLLLQVTEKVDVAAYINGQLVGECDFGWLELTPHCEANKEVMLTLVYRKRVWTQDCGKAVLWHVDAVTPRQTQVISSREVAAAAAGKGKKLALPLSVAQSAGAYAEITADKECLVRFTGKNVLVTAVADGRAIGRAVVGWTHAPAITGGEPPEIYYDPVWGGELYLYVRALGNDACLTGADVISIS